MLQALGEWLNPAFGQAGGGNIQPLDRVTVTEITPTDLFSFSCVSTYVFFPEVILLCLSTIVFLLYDISGEINTCKHILIQFIYVGLS